MTIATEASATCARRILEGRGGLSAAQINTAIGLLIDAGILQSGEGNKLAASAQRHAAALRVEAERTAKRLGLEPDADTGMYDAAEVSARMSGADVPTRMGVKDLLSSAGLMQ